MLMKGKLFIVSTPIGNMKDISFRAIDILKEVELILAEDTRHTNKLLANYGIKRKILSCHEFNESDRIKVVLEYLERGDEIALVSDAGTPLISDPGYKLVSELRNLGVCISPVPGPCAFVAALSASGLPSDQFQFKGFLPSKSSHRKKIYEDISDYQGTSIFYESVHRIKSSLEDLVSILGDEREIVLAKELTKQYEFIIKDTSKNVYKWILDNPDKVRGEYVILIHGISVCNIINKPNDTSITLLKELIPYMPLKRAVKIVSNYTSIKKNALYDMALLLKEENT